MGAASEEPPGSQGRRGSATKETDGAERERERGETPPERLDRNTSELVNELRVAGTGVQVLFAFLLILPFNTGFRRVSATERYIYYVSLLCVAVAAVLLIAPSVHHRILFHEGEKAYVVRFGTRVAVIAAGFLCAGLTGILVLISDYLFGSITAIVVGVSTAVTVITIWFLLPLRLLLARHRRS